MPRATKTLLEVVGDPNMRSVRYTTADSLIKILASKSIWMCSAGE